ncbi:hypothetical protein BOX37_13685 [Nocardia mangyaensis]|uniref:DM13 domain-containing protein n=1 Tax=Nocardia mangyaensis TaxID=2213200 RepID=A0A1J0VS39_9NOCA|nr:hypothetical protein BOX37_13685 [Nocardia mangyaensis]
MFTTVRVDETAVVAPDGGTVRTIASGSFLSPEHSTSGAALLQAPDGTVTLRLADLRTSHGPALRVWLSDQPVEPRSGSQSRRRQVSHVGRSEPERDRTLCRPGP